MSVFISTQERTSGRPWYFTTAALLILLAGFAVRLWGISDTSLWVDEAFTEFRVSGSLQDTFNYLSENPGQTPLHYILLHAFPRSNELLLRMPSVWLALGGIALMMGLTIRLTKDFDLALLAGALLTFNPYHIWISRMARAYSLLFFLGLLSCAAFLMLLQGNRRRIVWAVFIVSSAGAYVTHHFALALPVAQYILFAFILRGNRGFFRRWLGAQVLAVMPFLLYIFRLMRQETVSVGAGWIPTPALGDLFLTLWNFVIGYDGTLIWLQLFGLIAGLAGVFIGLYVAWRDRKSDRVALYWFWLLVLPLVLVFLISVSLQSVYVDRYFVVVLPAVVFLMLKGWTAVVSVRLRFVLAGIVVLTGIFNVMTIFHNNADEREDWRSAAHHIERGYKSGDGLLVEMPNRLIAVLYYLEADIDYAWLSDGGAQVQDVKAQFEQPVNRLWVVYRNPFDDGHRQNLMPTFDPFEPGSSPLPEWLAPRRDRVIAIHEFNGVTVLLVDVQAEFAGVHD